MMKTINKILFVALLLVLSVAVSAQTHWTCNPNDYRYDMTAYMTVTIDGQEIDPATTELAAFVGKECRGVAEAQDMQGHKYYYLRIRSNSASGETITFKAYVNGVERVVSAENTIVFESMKMLGIPSSPLQLISNAIPGDANGDGDVDDQDLMLIVNYLIGITSDKFQFAGADYNGDGEVDDQDLMKIVNVLLGGF